MQYKIIQIVSEVIVGYRARYFLKELESGLKSGLASIQGEPEIDERVLMGVQVDGCGVN